MKFNWKFSQVTSAAALVLVLGSGARVAAQHESERKPDKPEKQEGKAQPQQRAPQQRQAQESRQPAQPRERPPQQQQRAQQPSPPAHQPQPRPERAESPQQAQRQTVPRQQPSSQHQQSAQRRPANGQRTNYAPPVRTRQQAQSWQQQTSWRQGGAWQGHSSWQQDRSSNWQSDHRTWAQRGGYGGYYIPQDAFSLHFGVGNWFRIQSQPVIVGGYPRFQYTGYSFLMVDPWPADWAEDWYAADDVYVGYDNGYYLYNRQYPGEAIAITVVL